MRVVDEVKRCQEDLSAGLELAGSSFQLPGEFGLFVADAVELDTQLVFGPAFFSCQVQEVAFLAVELFKLAGELLTHLIAQLEMLVDSCFNASADPVAKFFGQDDGIGVVLLNGFFHDIDRHIRVVAELLLPTSAQEVKVLSAVTTSRHDGVAVFTTPTPDHAFEVVGVLPFAGATPGVRVENALHAVKQLFTHQRLVPPLVFNTLIGDSADVVAITQHFSQRFAADRFVLSRCSQVEIGHNFPKAIECVQAGAHQLKRFAHQRGTLFIKGDGVHLVAVNVNAHIGITEFRLANGAAIARLVGHLDFDVCAGASYLHPVYDVSDGLHTVRFDALTEVFLG